MINRYNYKPMLPATPFSFSILVDSPIRRDLLYAPVSAMIFPLASMELPYASMIIAGLDILMSFLFRWSLAHPPNPSRPTPDLYPVTLSFSQLSQFVQAAINGNFPIPFPEQTAQTIQPVQSAPGQGYGPTGTDEPLFPDNFSVSLVVTAPFAPFDGSPDTSFNVPLFEIPGAPGNLIIALGLMISQFMIERTGIGTPNSSDDNNDTTSMVEWRDQLCRR